MLSYLLAYSVPIAMLAFIVWHAWKILRSNMAWNRRQRRVKELEAIVCSTQHTSEERQAAMGELLDSSLGSRD